MTIHGMLHGARVDETNDAPVAPSLFNRLPIGFLPSQILNLFHFTMAVKGFLPTLIKINRFVGFTCFTIPEAWSISRTAS
jgi:hypothetical protein